MCGPKRGHLKNSSNHAKSPVVIHHLNLPKKFSFLLLPTKTAKLSLTEGAILDYREDLKDLKSK